MSPSRGAALPAAMLAALGFAVVIAGSYALMRVQVRMTVYEARQAQAQAIAEAGLEDGLNKVALTSGWKTGYPRKDFAGGYYTVSVSTDQAPWITSTGYSAPVPIMGRAARTVKAQAALSGFMNFSASTFTVNWGMAAYDSNTTAGRTPSCKLSDMNSNGCQFGAHVLANTAVVTAAGAIRINGDAIYASATSTAPAAATVAGSVSLALASSTVAIEDGSAFLASNDNNAAHISPFAAYSTTTMILTVNPAVGNVTLSSGTYYFKGINVSSAILKIDLNNPTDAASIYLAGNLFVSPQGSIDSSLHCIASGGGCRAYNVHVYGQGGRTMNISGYTAVSKTANLTYIDLYCPSDDIIINQRVLGRLVGKTVKILNPYGTGGIAYPTFFFDVNFGVIPGESTNGRWIRNSWSESYYRP